MFVLCFYHGPQLKAVQMGLCFGITTCLLKKQQPLFHFFFFSAVLSQTIGGGSGHGQSDGRHGADQPLHQPAG